MMTLAQLFIDHESDFLARYGKRLRSEHHRSCGHCFCPSCQHHHNQQWLQRQQQKLLPCEYYLVTFTLPAELRGICWRHIRVCYQMLFQAAKQTLREFALNDKQLGGEPGMTAVLHTHSRQLNFHPHVHLVIPAGVLSGFIWKAKHSKYLFNGKALTSVFRAKFLTLIKQQNISLTEGIRPTWVAQCEAVGRGDKALIYLSRYLYRGVISEQNIQSVQTGLVPPGSNKLSLQ